MFITFARSWFAQAMKKPVNFLQRVGITPNQLTLTSLLFLIASLFLFLQQEVQWGGVLLLLSYLCDAFDGALARQSGASSHFGHFFDKTVDALRSGSWLALAFAGYLPFSLASFIIFSNLLGHIMANLIAAEKLDNANIPVVVDTVVIIAAISKEVVLFGMIILVLQGTLQVANVLAIFIKRKRS